MFRTQPVTCICRYSVKNHFSMDTTTMISLSKLPKFWELTSCIPILTSTTYVLILNMTNSLEGTPASSHLTMLCLCFVTCPGIPENHGQDSSLRKISDISRMTLSTSWINYWGTTIKKDSQRVKPKPKPTLVCDHMYVSVFCLSYADSVRTETPVILDGESDSASSTWKFSWERCLLSPPSCTSQYIDSIYLASYYLFDAR